MSILSPPAALIPWLTCTNSLTEKLRKHAGDAQIQVLRHKWDLTDTWDKQVLKLTEGTVIHREIIMRAHQIPCWYARTILPEQTVFANLQLFERLKHESLGQLIFHSGCIKRVSLHYDCLSSACMELNWLSKEILLNLFPNTTAMANLCIDTVLESSCTTCTPRFSAPCRCINSLTAARLERSLLHTASQQNLKLWYRLSIFTLKATDARFYLLEVLLPGLEKFW